MNKGAEETLAMARKFHKGSAEYYKGDVLRSLYHGLAGAAMAGVGGLGVIEALAYGDIAVFAGAGLLAGVGGLATKHSIHDVRTSLEGAIGEEVSLALINHDARAESSDLPKTP